MHVARNKISGGNDDAGQKLQSVYDKNTEKDCANQAKKHSKKKKRMKMVLKMTMMTYRPRRSKGSNGPTIYMKSF